MKTPQTILGRFCGLNAETELGISVLKAINRAQSEAYNEGVHDAVLKCAESAKVITSLTYGWTNIDKESILAVEPILMKGK